MINFLTKLLLSGHVLQTLNSLPQPFQKWGKSWYSKFLSESLKRLEGDIEHIITDPTCADSRQKGREFVLNRAEGLIYLRQEVDNRELGEAGREYVEDEAQILKKLAILSARAARRHKDLTLVQMRWFNIKIKRALYGE